MRNESWIVNGIILTQNARRQVLRAHLEIVDGRIAGIHPRLPARIAKHISRSASKRDSAHAPLRVIDAEGLVVAPGFVQAHVHLCQTLFRNQADDLELLDWLSKRIWVMEAAHTEQTLRTSALMGIYELLSSGTTTILDMGTVRHTEAILDAVLQTGIRASVGKCLMDHPRTTPENLREATSVALSETSTLYRKWHGAANDRIRMSYAPRFVVSCTEELLTHVSSVSREQNALIHTHASENLKEIQLVKRLVNCENIEYLHQLGLTSSRLVLAHCIWLKPNEMSLLKRSGTHVVHCPSSNLKLASGIARIPEMLERGINVALGADGAPCNNNLNIFQEMRLAALIHKPGNGPKAMRAQQVLDLATLGGAQALNWQSDIGSIEVGKKADLVGLDLFSANNGVPAPDRSPIPSRGANAQQYDPGPFASSIVYSTQPQHVRWTLVDGLKVYDGRKVQGIQLQRLLAQVLEAQSQITQKISKRQALNTRQRAFLKA